MTMTKTTPQAKLPCHIVELRQYTLRPGQRDVLIELFEREFIETQEAVGMTVMGQFRDLDDADRLVWLRGFADMASRHAALAAFYDGPVWQAHRQTANATMVDSDNVLLLRPAWSGSGITMQDRARASPTTGTALGGLLDASIFYLHQAASDELIDLCRQTMSPVLKQAGAQVLGWYVSETSPNNFPRLPVRQGEHVLVGLAMFDSALAFDAFVGSGVWGREVQPQLDRWLARPTQTHRLMPTARSAIHA
jgi:quinol monooxygenase YgiN